MTRSAHSSVELVLDVLFETEADEPCWVACQ